MQKYFNVTSSDKDIIRRDLLRELIYTQADDLLMSKEAVEMMPIDALDIKLDIPTATKLDPTKIAEGVKAPYSVLTYFNAYGQQDKYQTNILVTDEAKARQIANTQVQMSLTAAARGMAYQIDYDTFAALAGATAGTTTASVRWTQYTLDGKAASPALDIANSIGSIFTNTTITDADVANIKVFYPASLWGHLARPMDVGAMQETIRNWAQREYKVSLFPTRYLYDKALVVVKSMETAILFTYNGNAIPTAEQERIVGVGDNYIFTRYYKPVIIPYTSAATTSQRIRSISNVI